MAFAGDQPASCKLADKSIVSRSSSGLAQVSNLGDIQIACTVPARPYSWGESRSPLKIATVVYKVLPDGGKRLVPSETNQSGGGYTTEVESVNFHLHIPLESAERDTGANQLLAKVEKSMPSEQVTEEAHRLALERIS